MLTVEHQDRIKSLCLALVGEKYVLGTEVDLAKVDPGMTVPEVCDLNKALDCSEAVQVVSKWATGIEVVDPPISMKRASRSINSGDWTPKLATWDSSASRVRSPMSESTSARG